MKMIIAIIKPFKLDDVREAVTEAIAGAAASGRIGDGKIFVQNLEQAIRIRTGEEGDDAL
jgi:nitrogen regulatory protein PII